MLIFERIEAEWEGKGINVSRAMVPGGWLVFVVHATGPVGQGGITFVPDPNHTWDGSSLPLMNSQDVT